MKYENTNEKKFKKTERQNIKYKEIYKMRRDKNVPPTIWPGCCFLHLDTKHRENLGNNKETRIAVRL